MNKTKNISARVTENEYKKIKELSRKNSMKLSDYIVHSCLNKNDKSYASQTTALIDIQKSLDKLGDGIIKKKEFIEKTKEILRHYGIYWISKR